MPDLPYGDAQPGAGDDVEPAEPERRRDGEHRRDRAWRAARRLRRCIPGHQQHRLRARLPRLVQQQRARNCAERQCVDGGSRGGGSVGAGDQMSSRVTFGAHGHLHREGTRHATARPPFAAVLGMPGSMASALLGTGRVAPAGSSPNRPPLLTIRALIKHLCLSACLLLRKKLLRYAKMLVSFHYVKAARPASHRLRAGTKQSYVAVKGQPDVIPQ